jgi:hypothetical protein
MAMGSSNLRVLESPRMSLTRDALWHKGDGLIDVAEDEEPLDYSSIKR